MQIEVLQRGRVRRHRRQGREWGGARVLHGGGEETAGRDGTARARGELDAVGFAGKAG
jgi:hypothetical protein